MPKKCEICQEQPISKAYFNCKTCSDISCIEEFKKQFYEKQNAKVVNKKPIRKVSPKRELDEIIYKSEKLKFFMIPKNKICPITGKEAVEVHHKWSGKDRNKYFLDTSTWLGVSRSGHLWIHNNPKEARELGYLF